MKKRVVLFIISILSICSAAWGADYFQLQNSDFEQWEKQGGGDEPVMWNTYATAGGSLGSMVTSTEQCSKSTDVRPGTSGSYSAAVKARKVLFSIIANGMITTGQIEGNSSSATSEDNHNITHRSTGYASPFTGRPDSVTGWVKTAFKSSSQLGRFYFNFHGNYDTQDPGTDMTQIIAVAGMNIPYNTNWQRLSIPVYYKGETLTILNEGGTVTRKPASNDERPSYCLASIATNYLAGKGDASDVLYIDDIVMIYNSKLKSLKINGAAVSGFNKDVYSYDASDKSYSEGIVTCESDGKFATIEQSFNQESGILTITVKGDDYSASSNKHTYTIAFKKEAASCDALLTSFKINGTQISGFSSSTKSYTLSDVYDNVSSAISYTTSDCAEASQNWNASTRTLTITVTSKSNYSSNSNTYTFQFHQPYESLLTSLKIGGSAVSGFSSSTYAYSTDHAYNESELSYTASEGATVTNSYNSQTYKLTLTVKGADYNANSSNSHTYTIQYHAPYGSQLSSLKVFGSEVANFSPSTYKYTVNTYAYYEDKVSYTADANATVEKSYNSSTNTLTLLVKGGDFAWNSTNTHSYTIQFHAPFGSVLTALAINGTSVNSFSSSKYDYSVKNTYTEGSTTITYTASDNATVTTSFDATQNVYTLVVKGGDYSQNSANTHTYTISFHDSYGCQLTDLKNNGTTIEGFSPSKYDYTLTETYAASSITYTADDDATVNSSYNESNYKMTLTVSGGDIADNPTNKKIYTITFHAPYGSKMLTLSINGKAVSDFSSNKYYYTVADAYQEGIVSYTIDSEATATESYDSSTNTLTITVSGGDIATNRTNKQTYYIKFHDSYGSRLTTLKLNGSAVSNFSPNVFNYSVKSTYDPDKTKITYTTDADASATASFNESTNTYVIVVKGGDFANNPSNTNTYTIAFHDSYGSQLTSLSVNGTSIEGFSPSKYEYTIANAYDPTLLNYTADAEASVETTTDAKNYKVTLKVKGGDFAENSSNYHTYVVNFHAPYEYQLTSLKINGSSVTNFSPNTYNYSVKSTYENASVTYTVSEDATATEYYDESSNTLIITVKSGDVSTANTNKYFIKFHNSYGSQLTSIKIDREEIPNFSPDQYAYYVEKSYSDVNVTYNEDEDATATSSYDETKHTLTITVKGGDYNENSANVHTYTVQFCAPSLLTSLKVNGSSVPNFRETKFSYTLSSVVYENATVSYTTYSGAKVDTTFDASSNLLTLKVSGSDIATFPNNYHIYTIQFHTTSGSLLTELLVNGTLIEGFDKKQFTYTVAGEYADNTITYTPDVDAKAKQSFNENTNVMSIVVTGGDIAENPQNTHTYKIQFYAPSKLRSLKADGISVSGFSPSVYDYSLLSYSYEDTRLLYMADEGATIDTTYDEQAHILNIKVSGKDITEFPDNYHVYHLQFSKPFESQLKDLKVDGTTIASFDRDVYSYKYDAVYGTVQLDIIPDDAATIDTTYNKNTHILTIVVKGGNIKKVSSNYHTYYIEFNDPTTYLSQLQSISINGKVLKDFDRNVYVYDIDGSLSNLSFVADEYATVTEVYDPQKNALELTVKGGNIDKDPENFHIYTIRFTAQFSFESYVTELSYNGQSVPSFNKEVYEYTINSTYDASNLNFSVSALAQFCADYDEDSKILTIVVWGGDFKTNNTNFHSYKIQFK